MADQYFSEKPQSARREAVIRATLRGRTFVFHTDAGVFARDKLDRGTELLAQALAVFALGSGLKNVAALSVLLVFLFFRPSGILGAAK